MLSRNPSDPRRRTPVEAERSSAPAMPFRALAGVEPTGGWSAPASFASPAQNIETTTGANNAPIHLLQFARQDGAENRLSGRANACCCSILQPEGGCGQAESGAV